MNDLKLTAPLSLAAYYELVPQMEHQKVELLPPRTTPTRKLSQIERATVRVELTTEDWMPGRGLLYQTSLRMHIWQDRGLLPYLSGHAIADHLMAVHWPAFPSQRALRAWELLDKLDAADLGVSITISTLDEDGMSYKRVRLHERTAKLGASERRQPNPR